MPASDWEDRNYPVYGTQGGGLVRELRHANVFFYIFIEAPQDASLGIKVGDDMPEGWDYQPVNEAARRAVADQN